MYSEILVPVAFDEDADAKIKAALDAARALAAEDARITVMHVIEQIPGYAVSYLPKDYIAESRAAVLSELEGLAATIPGARACVVDGHSGRTILDYAQENGNDLIVIASHRPGMQDLLLGSTASQVVRHAACSVHVIR
ncbi:universal stress protein [Thalassococcus lentus]|uniref:Universal stress protein n=1 Tax=Thalassococcus lentus TaxID=1210524 RepID=A0ABT4XWI2_9RHOB|nr:universal stress protein [Thalassococcus lentus]MDA7426314.1 universal stress protein [Thalassococcus lentus]